MTIKGCVDKTCELNADLEKSAVFKSYRRFYVSMMLTLTIILYWVWAVVSVLSSRLVIGVELGLSVVFVVMLDTFLRLASESEKAYNRIRKYGKFRYILVALLVLTIAAVAYLKVNYIL